MTILQTSPALWQPLRDELARWRDAGLSVRLWLRDDDAVEPTGRLDALLDVTAAHRVPLLLAVIPALATSDLARRIVAENANGPAPVHIAVHGWRHVNHAPLGEKSQEFGPHRPLAAMRAELVRGRERLDALFGTQLLAVLVPPWNRLDPALLAHLPGAGFSALSTFGENHLPGAPAAPDQDDFRLKQPKIMNLIDSNNLVRDASEKPVPTFPHPALRELISRRRTLSSNSYWQMRQVPSRPWRPRSRWKCVL